MEPQHCIKDRLGPNASRDYHSFVRLDKNSDEDQGTGNTNPLKAALGGLYDHLERDYSPTLTPKDDSSLYALDASLIDGTLTETHLKRTKAKMLKDRLRAYEVNHATGTVDPAYWEATDADGITNLQHRRPLHSGDTKGRKGFSIRRTKGGHWLATVGRGSDRTGEQFTSRPQAMLWVDCEIERRLTDKATHDALNHPGGTSSDIESVRRDAMTTYTATAITRAAAINTALSKPCPMTGQKRPWSAILRELAG